jgi:DNA polymerase-3 subunit delta'
VRLLKTLEEPSPGVRFVLLADRLTPELTTIHSRCATVTFGPLEDAVVAAVLAREGHPREAAERAARACAGNLERARLLAADRGFAERLDAFARVPQRLDGSGRAVSEVGAELDALLDRAVEPVRARHARELAELEDRVALTGERGAGRRALEARHKREVRTQRTDELRAGLARLAATYHEALTARPNAPEAAGWAAAVTAIHRAMGHLGLNAREDLVLEALLLRCPSLVPVASS